jgi:hypothetical protein
MKLKIALLLGLMAMFASQSANSQVIYFNDGSSYELAEGESVFVSGGEVYSKVEDEGTVSFTSQVPVVATTEAAEAVVKAAEVDTLDECSQSDFDLEPCQDPATVPTCVFDYNPTLPGIQCLPEGVTRNTDGSIDLGGPTPQKAFYDAYEFVQDNGATLADLTTMAAYQPGNYSHAISVLNARIAVRSVTYLGISSYEYKWVTSEYMDRVVALGDLVESLYNLGFTKTQIHNAYVEGK